PNYHAPQTDTPGSYRNATSRSTTSRSATGRPSTNPATTQSVIDGEHATWVDWWTKFGDKELDSLVARAVVANHELAIAPARVTEARAVERIAKSALYPTVGLSAGFLKTRGSSAGFGFPYGLPGEDSNLFQIGFDASYEVDLFGGVRRTIEATG